MTRFHSEIVLAGLDDWHRGWFEAERIDKAVSNVQAGREFDASPDVDIVHLRTDRFHFLETVIETVMMPFLEYKEGEHAFWDYYLIDDRFKDMKGFLWPDDAHAAARELEGDALRAFLDEHGWYGEAAPLSKMDDGFRAHRVLFADGDRAFYTVSSVETVTDDTFTWDAWSGASTRDPAWDGTLGHARTLMAERCQAEGRPDLIEKTMHPGTIAVTVIWHQ